MTSTRRCTPRSSLRSKHRVPSVSSMQRVHRLIVFAGCRCPKLAGRRRRWPSIEDWSRRLALATASLRPPRCAHIFPRLHAPLSRDLPKSRRAVMGRDLFRARSGAKISFAALGFGSAPLGNMNRVLSEEEAEATLTAAWSVGVRYFDTAPLYGHGLSEIRLGRTLRDKSDFVL